MVASVLGKRTRSSTVSADALPCETTRSKRRTICVNDENDNPFVTRALTTPSPKTPVKINAHFSVSKFSVKSRTASSPKQCPADGAGTPPTPSTPSNTNVYNAARKLFSRCSDPTTLVGRDEEKTQVSKFISERLDDSTGGCLYVSGPPGTGKSAFVTDICRGMGEKYKVKVSSINCMSIKNSKDLASTLSRDLDADTPSGTTFDSLAPLFSKVSCVVILDEIDRLVDMDLQLLYKLFEWSMASASKLVLVGIANALDLTDRFLPRLKSRNLKPTLLPFMPYTAQQIAQIITTKLDKLTTTTTTPFLHPAAIQLCAKKVASQTGDLRKAFDICHGAIGLAEQEARAEAVRNARVQESPSKKTPLSENLILASPTKPKTTATVSVVSSPRQTRLPFSASSLSHLTAVTAPRATIAHVARITAQVFGQGATQRLGTLNLQQKAVLCAMAALEKKLSTQQQQDQQQTPTPSTPSRRSKTSHQAPTIKQIYEAYSSLCRREKLLHPLTGLEFRDVVGGLEALSLVLSAEAGSSSFASSPLTPSRTPSRRGGRGNGLMAMAGAGDERRLASSVGRAELAAALQGPGSDLLMDMMSGKLE